MNERELLDLKHQIEDAKTSVSELKGQQQMLMKQLKDEWKCNTIEEAERKIKSMGKEIDALQTQIDEGVKELEEKYGSNK